jgi:hypothetical protein
VKSTKTNKEPTMNLEEVYHLAEEIGERLGLKSWQARGLALLSIGIMQARSCTLSQVAEKLVESVGTKADSLERRLQRWIANAGVQMEVLRGAWVSWVLKSVLGPQQKVVLVDLTKISNRLDVMMVGLAYRSRCIPLVWRVMKGQVPWPDTQVNIIMDLLKEVKIALPAGQQMQVQADRGISNSPALVQALLELDCHFLLRVPVSVKVRLENGWAGPIGDLIQPGKMRCFQAEAFQTAGWLPVTLQLRWKHSMSEPWCLITNDPQATPAGYALRMWQEESFKDLKSGGWQWQRTQVRHPAHASRLLLAMSLAYAWTITLGTLAIRHKDVRRRVCRGKRRQYSVFRLGLRYLSDLIGQRRPIPFGLIFWPPLTNP